MTEKGRPKKYVTIEMWNVFMTNHWKHLKWKVNGLLLGMIILVSLTITILFGVASMIFRGA